MKIVFAKTRYHYDSYMDFWRLVELSGFDTCFFDEIDLQAQDIIYITTPINGEQPPHLRNHLNRKCKVVWWFLERPDGDHGNDEAMMTGLHGSLDDGLSVMDAVWTSDLLIKSFDHRFQFVPLGGHRGLQTHYTLPIQYDYTHQSYAWGRRAAIYNELRGRGLVEGPSCFGPEREKILASSKIVLHLQQYHLPLLTPLRYVLAAAYSIPIVTEQLAHVALPLKEGDLIQAPYEKIADTVFDLCSFASTEQLNVIGRRIFERYCVEYTFRRGVEEGVQEFLQRST